MALIASSLLSAQDPSPDEFGAVVVDYDATSDIYHVQGDVELLSRRLTPGSTFQLIIGAVALEAGAVAHETEIPCRAEVMAAAEQGRANNRRAGNQRMARYLPPAGTDASRTTRIEVCCPSTTRRGQTR